MKGCPRTVRNGSHCFFVTVSSAGGFADGFVLVRIRLALNYWWNVKVVTVLVSVSLIDQWTVKVVTVLVSVSLIDQWIVKVVTFLVSVSLIDQWNVKVVTVLVSVSLIVKRLMYLMCNPGMPGAVTVKIVALDLPPDTVSS
jgi:hypothetical protein